VLSQSADHLWVILIDRDLPGPWRMRLEALVEKHPRVKLHVYRAEDRYGSLSWLLPYLSNPSEGVLTTLLDDDDGLAVGYLEKVRRLAEDQRAQGASVALLGATEPWQWDFVSSPRAPLGYAHSWHRASIVRMPSTGFSVFSLLPFDVCILGMLHNLAERYLSPAGPNAHPSVRAFRSRYDDALARTRLSGPSCVSLTEVGERVGLVVNHFHNDTRRLFQGKVGGMIADATSFPGIPVDWRSAERAAPLFRKSFGQLRSFFQDRPRARSVRGHIRSARAAAGAVGRFLRY
jgi:hypothetical protein